MDNIYSAAQRLVEIQNIKLELTRSKVRRVIIYGTTDVDTIVYLLDELLDLYSFFGSDEIEVLFSGLIECLRELDKSAADDYLSYFNEQKYEKSL